MRKILLIAFATIAFALSSCEKCVQCSYHAPGYPPYNSGEYCTKRQKDLDAFKSNVNEEAKLKGTSAACVDIE